MYAEAEGLTVLLMIVTTLCMEVLIVKLSVIGKTFEKKITACYWAYGMESN